MATPLEAFVAQFEDLFGIRPETCNALMARLEKELQPIYRIRPTPEFLASLKSMEESMEKMLNGVRQSPGFKEMVERLQSHTFDASDWVALVNRPLVNSRPSPAPKPKLILGFLGGVPKTDEE